MNASATWAMSICIEVLYIDIYCTPLLIYMCRLLDDLKGKIPNTERYLEESKVQLEELNHSEQQLGSKVRFKLKLHFFKMINHI